MRRKKDKKTKTPRIAKNDSMGLANLDVLAEMLYDNGAGQTLDFKVINDWAMTVYQIELVDEDLKYVRRRINGLVNDRGQAEGELNENEQDEKTPDKQSHSWGRVPGPWELFKVIFMISAVVADPSKKSFLPAGPGSSEPIDSPLDLIPNIPNPEALTEYQQGHLQWLEKVGNWLNDRTTWPPLVRAQFKDLPDLDDILGKQNFSDAIPGKQKSFDVYDFVFDDHSKYYRVTKKRVEYKFDFKDPERLVADSIQILIGVSEEDAMETIKNFKSKDSEVRKRNLFMYDYFLSNVIIDEDLIQRMESRGLDANMYRIRIGERPMNVQMIACLLSAEQIMLEAENSYGQNAGWEPGELKLVVEKKAGKNTADISYSFNPPRKIENDQTRSEAERHAQRENDFLNWGIYIITNYPEAFACTLLAGLIALYYGCCR